VSVPGNVLLLLDPNDLEGNLNSLDETYLSTFVQHRLPHPRLRIGKFLYSLCK
jgi:hypothetical protein